MLTFSYTAEKLSQCQINKLKRENKDLKLMLSSKKYKDEKKCLMTTMLPVVLCGCKTWFLTLRKEHRLRVFENRALGEYLDLEG
jgi:hypothetical protein